MTKRTNWRTDYEKKDKSKQEFEEEIIILRKEHLKLELENKVLKKANEILKKK